MELENDKFDFDYYFIVLKKKTNFWKTSLLYLIWHVLCVIEVSFLKDSLTNISYINASVETGSKNSNPIYTQHMC